MIEVNDVTRRYGDTLAVDHLSFTVKPGIVTGFLGPNGAGKTTTMRMILGLDTPSSGAGHRQRPPYREHPGADARGWRAAGREGGERRPHRPPAPALDRRGPAAFPNSGSARCSNSSGCRMSPARRVGGFSLGMYQRLGIAAALLGDPRILIFDEPVNGLDPEGIRWIRSLLQRLAAEGRTIFLSSHLMSEMEETADHIIVIGRGRLIADASIAEFTARSTSSHVRVVSPQAATLAPLLERAGATVTRDDGALIVTGMEAPLIGSVAAAHQH